MPRPVSSRTLVLMLGSLTALGPLSIDAYLPALPAIEKQLGAAQGAGAITLATFFLGLAGAQLAWGALADRVGRRPPLLAGLILYTIGSVACGLAPTLHTLALARFVQGVGGAAGMVTSRALVRDVWSGREVARVLSLITLVMGAAPVFAPLLGGALLTVVGWRVIFAVLTAAGVTMTVIAWVAIPETRPAGAPASVGSGVRALLTHRQFLGYSLAGGAASAGMFTYISGSPSVFIDQLGAAPTLYSIFFGLNASGLVLLSQRNRALLARHAPERIALAGVAALAAVAGLLVLFGWRLPRLWTIEPCLFVYVATLGVVSANTAALALEQQAARAGLASALMGTLQFAMSAAASAAVVRFADGTPVPMAAIMLVCAVAAGILLRVASARPKAAPAPPARASASST